MTPADLAEGPAGHSAVNSETNGRFRKFLADDVVTTVVADEREEDILLTLLPVSPLVSAVEEEDTDAEDIFFSINQYVI